MHSRSHLTAPHWLGPRIMTRTTMRLTPLLATTLRLHLRCQTRYLHGPSASALHQLVKLFTISQPTHLSGATRQSVLDDLLAPHQELKVRADNQEVEMADLEDQHAALAKRNASPEADNAKLKLDHSTQQPRPPSTGHNKADDPPATNHEQPGQQTEEKAPFGFCVR